jgi:RHS repeat-associated protein
MGRKTVRQAIAALALIAATGGTSPALATSLTRTSSFTYDTSSGLLTEELVEPGGDFELDTTYTYDAFGNKLQATVSSPVPVAQGGLAAGSRTSTATYDSLGEFVTQQQNVKSQIEKWTYDPRFGTPLTHIGPNEISTQLKTSWVYDAYGRKIQEIRPDGNQTSWSYQYCSGVAGGSATCPQYGAYLSIATPLNAQGQQNGPMVTVYYDSLEREIARNTQGFGGSAIQVATQYDSNGRVLKTSRPYFTSGGTPEWTTFTYDTLGRPLTETGPGPNGGQVQHAYRGLTTTDTRVVLSSDTDLPPGNNEVRTTTKNSQGEVVSVTDPAGGVMTFTYDPFGNLLTTTDPTTKNIVTYSYDIHGRYKTGMADPDLGTWSYGYDVLGELVSEADADGNTYSFVYDVLGRMTSRTDKQGTSTWTYDTQPNGIGKLAQSQKYSNPTVTYTYDSLGRETQVTLVNVVGGASTFTFGTTYDSNGQIATVTYPTSSGFSTFSVAYTYDSWGFLTKLADNTTGASYWQANTMDAELHLTKQTAGNNVVTQQGFDPLTGRLTAIDASGPFGEVESFSYAYDSLGNLANRADNNEAPMLSESFGYDALNRVVSETGTNVSKTFKYDVTGNLTYKSDVGTYTYPPPGSPHPHAVQSIAGNINTSFTYDANGNLLTGNGRSVTYKLWNNLAAQITQGTTVVTINYDIDRDRVQENTPQGSTTYLRDKLGSGALAEQFTGAGGGPVQWNYYLFANGEMVGVHFEAPANGACGTATSCTRYFHKDHLGSIATITDDTGAAVEHDSYDVWGKRRSASDWTDDPTDNLYTNRQTTRGYTGQEEIQTVALVNLNARIYDPSVGRFMTADLVVGEPNNSQNWNRYSYVGNNPLAFTDPTGMCFLGCFWKPIVKFFGSILRNPIVQEINVIVAAAACAEVGASAACASAQTAINTGIDGGSIGDAFKAAAITYATAEAFQAVGGATYGDVHAGGYFYVPGDVPGTYNAVDAFGYVQTPYFAENVLGHAAIGCAAAAAGGGSCGSGAASAGFSAIAPVTVTAIPTTETGIGDFFVNFTATSTLGGIGSIAGGGKFQNGAETVAFMDTFVASADLYRSVVGWDPNMLPGTVYASAEGNCCAYAGNVPGPDVRVFGSNVPLTRGGDFLGDFLKQGGGLENVANWIPGVNGLSAFHDDIFNEGFLSFNPLTNVGSMLPAAAVTYLGAPGALLRGWQSNSTAWYFATHHN